MDDETLLRLALEILDKGGMPAFAIAVIVGVWLFVKLKLGSTTATSAESQMAAALKDLAATVKANHESAQEQREELRKAVSGHGERIARIEGRMDGL